MLPYSYFRILIVYKLDFQLVIAIIAVVAAKPVESDESYDDEHYDPSVVYEPDLSQQHDELGSPQATYDPEYSEESRKTKRSVIGDVVNRKFFENINDNINRQVRQTNDDDDDDDDTPTIQLSDLLSAVEHTLIHSAHNLAKANATNTTSFNSDETSTVIALPITFPTPATTEATLLDEVEVSSTSELNKVTEKTILEVSNNDDAKRLTRKADESIIPIEGNGHLGLLTPITFSPSKVDDQIKIQEIKPSQVSDAINATSESPIADNDSQNVTIIQTIKSTEISPVDADSVVRVQQQHITLFSAGAGVFPQLPSVDLDLLATLSSSTPKTTADCTEDNSEGSSSSEESNEKKSSSSPAKSSNESSDESAEKPAHKCKSNIGNNSNPTSATSESTVKKIDNLQEKIAEVEADPVILTQGI